MPVVIDISSPCRTSSRAAYRRLAGGFRVVTIGAYFAISFAAIAADPAITVSAKQRYPWNGLVDLQFTITGTSGTKYDTSFTAKDLVGGTNIAMRTIRKSNGAAANVAKEQLLPGTYNWVWDAAADLPEDWNCARMTVTGKAVEPTHLYMVINLSSGSSSSSYPVSYLDAVPSGGWTDTYKTTRLVLRRCEAGTFKMQGSQNVTLTKPFYIGVFETTKKQWSLVTGETTQDWDMTYPALPRYHAIRGSTNGAKWPASSTVDASSFLGKLRTRTNNNFDLSTEAQWEYACRAGTTTTYYWGNSLDGNYCWYYGNAPLYGNSKWYSPVGGKKANAWVLYDMSGNSDELCLDWYGTLTYGTDPKGPSSGTDRVTRGGSCNSGDPTHGHPTSELTCSGRVALSYGGFRIALTLSN